MERRKLKNILIVTATAILVFIVAFFQSSVVHGNSMSWGIKDGDCIILGRIPVLMKTIERGDIVTFDSPYSHEKKDYIKRVIGLPGDRVVLKDGRVWVNGKELYEPYVECRDSWIDMSITVPSKHYFVLGDNRPRSDDSRFFGPIHENEIIGKYLGRYWPIFRADTSRSVFAND